MKHLILFFAAALAVVVSQAQSYLPLTGGTLTGNLSVSSGNQIQAPYYGFNAGTTQPANSGNVSIFTNSTTTTLDIVGWSSGWRFIHNNGSTYPAPVAQIDANGKLTTWYQMVIASNQYGNQLKFTDSTGASTVWWQGMSDYSGNYFSIGEGSTNSSRLVIRKTTGNVGIGTTSPAAKLDISGNMYAVGGESHFASGTYSDPFPGTTCGIKVGSGGIAVNGSSYFASGNVGIGTTNTQGYTLAVNGDAIFTKIYVKPYANWPDYVFSKSYKLLSLKSLDEYIQQNNHLPNVPSEKEIQKSGVDIESTEAKLLEKIEELTLYVIEQNKRQEQQDQVIENQGKLLAQQQKLLNQLQAEVQLLQQGHN